ncbi:MAG: hypothetical protein AABW90_02330 [Nanoarchaeota archaeon]
MKKGVLNLIGILLIFLGVVGILLILNGKIVGYATSNALSNTFKITSWTTFNKTLSNRVEFSEIGEVITREGKKKTIDLNIENTGDKFLNNCKLMPKKLESWIYSSQIEGIAAGEKTTFSFDVNVPEETEQIDYQAKLELNCDEGSFLKEFTISVINGFEAIEIKEIKEKNKILNVSYTFDNKDFIGESVLVEIWIKNSDNVEVKRMIDIFPINEDKLIERNILINLKEQPTGIYVIYFALSSDLNDYLKKSFVIGKSLTTGDVIFKVAKGKGIPYIIFLIIIGLGVFFVFKSHRESLQKEHETEHP